MNTQSQSSMVSRSPILKFFRWLFSWRIVRRILIGFGWLAAIIALFYGVENWRGRRAWNHYRQQLEARGAQLDFKSFIPQSIPDDQNFAATPLIKSWFPRLTNDSMSLGTNYDLASTLISNIPKNEAQKNEGRRLTDLVAWKLAFDEVKAGHAGDKSRTFESGQLDAESRAKAAPAVLEELKSGALDEIRAASQRPFSLYPVVYDLNNPWGILLPHLAKVKSVCQRLQLMANAELALGRSDKALEDLKLLLYVSDSLKQEPFLISYLVRNACFQIAIQPIWEGLAEHRWTEAQLKEIQTQLQSYNFLEDSQNPLHGERAAGVLTVDLVKKDGKFAEMLEIISFGADVPARDMLNLLTRIIPGGWYSLEKVNYCRLYENQLGGTYDPEKRTVSPARVAANNKELEREISGGRLGRGFSAVLHHQMVASQLLPALGGIMRKGAMAQVAADQAAIACALERYRLAHHQFPDSLDALKPQFMAQMPKDVITGEPYKYQRTADGQFILYSIGWNEKDDGGAFWKPLFNEKQGDWVWQSAPQ